MSISLVSLRSFSQELVKIAEYAPGIPSRETSHELPKLEGKKTWEFAVHDHEAERRGPHFDLRLGDPETGHAHSWAMPREWPKPGQKSWAIQQPTHTVRYMDFAGRIEEGYGKGDVKLHDRSKVEVLTSRPGHISFNLYRSSGPEEYVLHRIDGKKWQLTNRTPTRKDSDLPTSKPKYREVPVDEADEYLTDEKFIASAKIDDAHNLFVFPESGQQVRAVSYRLPKKGTTGIIDHTHKVSALEGLKVPAGLGGTILRGGLYAMSPKTGRATPASELAGMLNTQVWKSRDKQEELGKLRPILYDVVKYKGRNMENAPYREKLKVLREVVEKVKGFELPPMAQGTGEKLKLLEDIRHGRNPKTNEGVVFWNLSEGEPPVKAKFRTDHDVYVKDIFPGEGKYQGAGAGGFTYSHTPDGPVAGRVGTGLSDELRKDMHHFPEKYRGLVARVTAAEKFKSHALRAPSFEGWHLDKNDPTDLANVVG